MYFLVTCIEGSETVQSNTANWEYQLSNEPHRLIGSRTKFASKSWEMLLY